MKNIKKYLIMTLALILTFIFNNINVYAAPSSITLKSKSNLYYFTENRGTDYISGYNFYRKELTDGTFVYCISNIDTDVPAGKTLSLQGEVTDNGLKYIITNGYPYKSFTGDNLKDYYITQSAIWEYFDETRGTNNWRRTTFTSSDTGMKGYVYNLVNEAKKAKSDDETLGIDITLANKTMTLDASGNYYVSNPIRVKLTGSNEFTVTLQSSNNNAIIKDKNGKERYTYQDGEEFYVYVPSSTKTSGNIDVTVKTQGETTKVYEYSANEGRLQNISLVVKEKKEISKSISLNYDVIVTKLKISKQDITTKTELKGASLVLKDETGKIIDSWVSTDTPHYIEGLEPGNYTLSETIAPDGYKLSTETISFTLLRDGKVKTVIMYNSKEDVTKLKISKQDITTKAELAGASLVLKDETGKIIDSWVSTDTPHYIEGLEPGNYTLSETIAPDGYKLTTETISFTLLRDGNVKTVVMYNEKYDVPITDLNFDSNIIIMAALIMLLGTGLVFYAKRKH